MKYRQGDVLIESVNTIPEGLKPTKETLLVRGEGRNHGHFIKGDVDILEVDPNDENITHYITVEDAELHHLLIDSGVMAEHKPIKIPKGTYKVIRQREYNPYSKAIELVQD